MGESTVTNPTYQVGEIEVTMRIADGKLTVDSRSGAKSGAVELKAGDFEAELVLHSSGQDQATATLTGAELSNFRTNVDAVLSAMVSDRSSVDDDRRVLASGFETLSGFDDGYGTTIDTEALNSLGILDESGSLPGGSRQVKCTVLSSGTAIINLLSEDDPGFTF